MENQLLPISPCKTQEHSVSTDALIREWLFRFGVEHKEDVAPRLPLWSEAFAGIDAAILERLFSRALKTCKFFPKVSEILDPLESAEKAAAPEAAEEAWSRVSEIRRVHWNPDIHRRDPNIPTPFERATAALSERVQQAARAAGVFRDFESVEALHTWAKKRFIESFIVWGEVEQDKFLLPDGEVKSLLAGFAKLKALPAPSRDWNELHTEGLEYAKTLNVQPERADTADTMPIRDTVVDVEGRMAELERQKQFILQKYATPEIGAIPCELQPVEASA
jgi:hypothetical protein